VTGGLTSTLAASIAANYSHQGTGYGVNLANGEQVEKQNSGGGRIKLLWQPDADTKVTLSGDYSESQGSNPAIRTVSRLLLTGQDMPGGRYDVDLDTQPYLHTQSGGGSLTAKHDFGSVDLTSITAYRVSFLHVIIDADQTPVEFVPGSPLLVVDETQLDRQFSQELQLSSHANGPFKWVLGAFYYWERDRSEPSSAYGSFVGGISNNYDNALLNSYAAYGQATYSIDPHTEVTAGLRFTLDQRSLAVNSTYDGFPSASEYDRKTFPKATWRLAIDHRFSPELMAYASYNRGFKSGSFQPDTFPIQALKPETLDAFEAGFKADLFDRKLRLNLAGFYYDYTNLQANEIENGELFVYDAPGSINYGIDADLIARPFQHFQINAGLSLLHARYKNGFTDSFWSVPLASGGNLVTQCPSTNPLFAPCDASGKQLQDTPSFTGNIGASYDIPTANSGTFTLSTNYYRNGGYYGDVQNRLRQNAYGLLDASLTWVDPSERYRVRGWAKNLTNSFYTMQYDALNYGDNIVAAPPRTYGVTLEMKY
jgi:iron complex outermembrane recepter protein